MHLVVRAIGSELPSPGRAALFGAPGLPADLGRYAARQAMVRKRTL